MCLEAGALRGLALLVPTLVLRHVVTCCKTPGTTAGHMLATLAHMLATLGHMLATLVTCLLLLVLLDHGMLFCQATCSVVKLRMVFQEVVVQFLAAYVLTRSKGTQNT